MKCSVHLTSSSSWLIALHHALFSLCNGETQTECENVSHARTITMVPAVQPK